MQLPRRSRRLVPTKSIIHCSYRLLRRSMASVAAAAYVVARPEESFTCFGRACSWFRGDIRICIDRGSDHGPHHSRAVCSGVQSAMRRSACERTVADASVRASPRRTRMGPGAGDRTAETCEVREGSGCRWVARNRARHSSFRLRLSLPRAAVGLAVVDSAVLIADTCINNGGLLIAICRRPLRRVDVRFLQVV